MKIRTHLVLLGLAILIPMVIFAVIAVVALDRQQRAAVERGAVETSRALSQAVDRELNGMLATLSTLATARSLERNDLTAFYEDARRVHASRPEWNTILLIAPTGQLVLDTFFPFGTVLPRIVERDSFEMVLRTGAPSVGPVQFGPISQQFASAIRVPVRRNGRIVYVLTGVLEVRTIQRLLSAQQIPEAWIGTVFDSKQTVVARTHGAEQFVGRSVSPEFVKVLETAREGWTVTHTLEGAAVYMAFSRSATTGWGVGFGIPFSVIDAPLHRSLWTIAGAGIVLLFIGTGFALLIGRRMARGLGAVAATGAAIGRRERVRPPSTGLAEVDQVAADLVAAGVLRDEAERALGENEARLNTTLMSIGDGVIATDNDGRVTFLNPAAVALTGWPEAEAVGEDVTAVFRIVNEHTGQPAENPVARVLTEGIVVGLANDTVLLSRDGREIPIEDSAAPIHVTGDVTSGVVLVFHDASARRQALAEFRVLANAAPVLVWMAGPDAGYTFFNQPWLDFTGRPLAAQLGEGWATGIHLDDLAGRLETYRSAFAGQRPFEMEYRLRRHDGEYRWILDRGVPRFRSDGRFAGYVGSCIDITDRRRGEEVRRYLAAIVQGSDDAIVSKTLDGIITSWNPGATRMFGYTADEAIGRSITLIIPPDRIEEEEEVLARSRRGEGIDHFETVRIRKDGARVEISLTVSPIREADGQIVGASKIARDISHAKRLERERAEALRREQTGRIEAEALAQVSRELTQSLDLPTVGQRIVASMCRLLEGAVAVLYAVESESGDLVAMARAGPFAPRLGNDYRLRQGAGLVGLAIRERQSVVTTDVLQDARLWYSEEERELIERAGHRAACAIPLVIQDTVIGALGIGYEPGRCLDGDAKALAARFGDLAAIALQNARSFAGEQVRRAHAEMTVRARDEFLAMLGHELRNPLGAVASAISLLNLIAPDERTAQPREIISRQIGNLTRLVDDLLDVGRLTFGRFELQRGIVDLATVVAQCVEIVSSRAPEHRIHVATSSVPVDGDPARLEQIVTNLLDNAVKYTPTGGVISVDVSQVQDKAVLRVRDSGIGIGPDLLPRMFDLFTQGDRSLDRSTGGLGLGLAVVKQLVRLHGGHVSATSAGPDEGSEFVVELPVASPNVASSTMTEVVQSLRPLRVLVVEDHDDARESLRLLLTAEGHAVTGAQDGPEGLEVLRSWRPDVALVDVGLPGLDGYAVARAVAADPDVREIPLVALTGYGQPEDRRRAIAAGFRAHLVKPVFREALIRTLVSVTAGNRAE